FQLGGRAEAGATGGRFGERLYNARMSVSQDQRSPRADVVQVLMAVEIIEERPLPFGDEDRLAADGAEGAGGAIDAARNRFAGSGERRLAFGSRNAPGSGGGHDGFLRGALPSGQCPPYGREPGSFDAWCSCSLSSARAEMP